MRVFVIYSGPRPSRLSADMQIRKDTYEIDTDKRRLDVGVIHTFLSKESYWAANRSREKTEVAIEHSICFGVYLSGAMVGFARVVSDQATFAYIGDVFIVSAHRGKGLSKMLMRAMIDHPDLQGLRRWVLATRDAHGLYSQFQFAELRHPDRWMERAAPDAY